MYLNITVSNITILTDILEHFRNIINTTETLMFRKGMIDMIYSIIFNNINVLNFDKLETLYNTTS